MGLMRTESAAHAILDRLEAVGPALAGEWTKAQVEIPPDGQLHAPGARYQSCIISGELGLVPIGRNAEELLEAYALLLTNAHTLIALARLGLEAEGSFDQSRRDGWPPRRCRFCGSDGVLVLTSRVDLGRRAFDVSCLDCGQTMVEMGPPLPRGASAPHGPRAS